MARNFKARNEFRKKNTKDGREHPTYIYRERGNQYDYLSLTHSERTEGVKKKPNPKDRRKAYVRPKAETAHVSSFGKRLLGWFFGDDDKDTVNKLKK